MLSNSEFGARQWHIPFLKHVLIKNCGTCISSQRKCWWDGRHLLGVPWYLMLKPQCSHVFCVMDCEWINLAAEECSWKRRRQFCRLSVVLSERGWLSWAAFFPLFPVSKRENCSYQWRLSVKHHTWIGEIRPSVFKLPFHKAQCTCVLFWKQFPTLIPSCDIKICAEPLLLGLETFEASSGTDIHYPCLRRWLWHIIFFES